jgi:hypothetical protein
MGQVLDYQRFKKVQRYRTLVYVRVSVVIALTQHTLFMFATEHL